MSTNPTIMKTSKGRIEKAINKEKTIITHNIIGSREGRLECRSEIIIVITPANTGGLIINKTDVKNIDQQYKGKNRKELIIERLLDAFHWYQL